MSVGGSIIGRNVKLGGTNGYIYQDTNISNLSYIKIENFQKTFDNHVTWKRGGTNETEGFSVTVDVNSGSNAPSTASTAGSTIDIMKITPTASITDLQGNSVREPQTIVFTAIFQATTDSKTYTYYIQNYSCGTLNEGDAIRNVFLKAEYIDDYDDVSEYHETVLYSAEDDIAERADDTDWDSLSVTVQPAVASKVRITMYCAAYDADGLIFVDPRPLIT